jgi:hypothetical protein
MDYCGSCTVLHNAGVHIISHVCILDYTVCMVNHSFNIYIYMQFFGEIKNMQFRYVRCAAKF